MKTSTKWLIFGGVFTSLVGALLHFAFEWSQWLPMALFAPVNESPWEHLKLAFWPSMLILLFEFNFVYKKESPKNFGLAKTIGILLMPTIILLIFYGYTAIIGTEILIIDILSFFVAVAIGQMVTYKLYNTTTISRRLTKWSSIALLVFAAFLIVFTFFPPHIPLFYDSSVGGYGII